MRWQHTPLTQWLGLSLLYGFALFVFYQENVAAYRYKPTQLVADSETARQPAGEITSGFRLEQPLSLSSTELPARDLGHSFCTSLLMANYKNRRNRGEFSVSLRIGQREQTIVLDAREVRDNARMFVCFDRFKLSDVLGQPAMLTVNGVDGRPGRSVTAWLMPSTTDDSRATFNGELIPQQLVLSTHVQIDARQHMFNAYILLALIAMLMSALTLAAYRSDRLSLSAQD